MTARRAVLVALLAISTACAPGDLVDRVDELVDGGAGATPAPTGTGAPDEPARRTAPPSPGTPWPDPPGPTPGADVAACEAADEEEMATTVRGQLDALADDDFEAAMGFASEAYRSATPPAAFEQMIVEGFPQLQRAEETEVAGCLTDGRAAVLDVRLLDEIGVETAMRYLLERDDDGWRISGASPADGADAPVT